MAIPELNNILIFASAAFFLVATPGPAVLYITSKSIEQGYKAGLASVLGINIGGLIHVFAAAFGLSALFLASNMAFSILKYAGACYLIYLGVQKFREKQTDQNVSGTEEKKQSLSAVCYEGILVNILNPKLITFFIAFLPVFINEERGSISSQILFLGLLFIIIASITDVIYVALSSKISGWITAHPSYLKFQKYIVASVYIILGIITLGVSKPVIKK